MVENEIKSIYESSTLTPIAFKNNSDNPIIKHIIPGKTVIANNENKNTIGDKTTLIINNFFFI